MKNSGMLINFTFPEQMSLKFDGGRPGLGFLLRANFLYENYLILFHFLTLKTPIEEARTNQG
jgi:hypothetical protein